MILQALHALYDRLAGDPFYQVPPPGFSLQKISFKVVLWPDGRLLGIEDARALVDGKPRLRQVRVLGVTKPPGSGLSPCFLWDNASYLLGYDPSGEDPARGLRAFGAFRARHVEAREEISSPAFDAVCTFLAGWDPGRATEFPVLADAAKTGFGLFQIAGESSWVHEDPSIVAWWERRQYVSDDPEVRGQCLLTGAEDVPLARLHEKVKGLSGGQGAGAPLVGFNDPVFESFGKEQGENAPVSESAARRYGAALNALLDGPGRSKHRTLLGDMTLAFWTERPTITEDVFAEFTLARPQSKKEGPAQDEATLQKLSLFVRALRQGREAYAELDSDPDATSFYLLGLSPNAGRVAVRFFLSASLSELLENLRQHHRDIGIDRGPNDIEFPSTWLLLRQAGREEDDIPPILEGPLLRAVVSGAAYPAGLYHAVLRRIRADRRVDHPRACVLKGYLNRNLNQEVSMSLDSGRTDPAYRLGRLFAALEKTQKDALGEGLNSTIRDSYYGSASATPATVFPRLLRLYQHHLAKLEGGRKTVREKLVQEIFDPLAKFPSHLDLAGQGLFAIGYYHQTRDFYTRRQGAQDNGSVPEEKAG